MDHSKKLPAFFYENAMGREPVRDWILGLSMEDRKVIGRDIQKAEFGWPLGMPYCRSLGPAYGQDLRLAFKRMEEVL